jgi:hypothetical protein
MRKAGRPQVPKNKALAPGISIRMSQNERKTVDLAVSQSGLPQSAWARKALLYVAEHAIRFD